MAAPASQTESGSRHPASAWYDDVSPDVSIVVVNFNKGALTARCLDHLWRNTGGRRYEIIVVDNGSSEPELRILADLPGRFQLLPLPANHFFGEGNNIGVQAARGKYIVLLNNDAFVTADWLVPLITVMEQEPLAGGVGPQFRYPDGKLQEAGAFVDTNGRTIQRGRRYPLDDAELNRLSVVDYCSAACFLTSKEIFDRISGFDPAFELAYYEDVDLCLKIASLGLLVYYCPQSVIHHIENASAAAWSNTMTTAFELNRLKFVNRWAAYLNARAQGDDPPLPPVPRLRRTAAAGGPTRNAVFYTASDLTPNEADRYLLAAACAMDDSYRVYLATDARYSEYRLDYLVRDLALDLSGISAVSRADLEAIGPVDLFASVGERACPDLAGLGRRNFYFCHLRKPASGGDFDRDMLGTYERVFVASRFMLAALRHQLAKSPVDVSIELLPPPVSTGIEPTHSSARHPGPVRTINIGRFCAGDRDHRQDVLIECVRRLAGAGTQVELILAGPLRASVADVAHYHDLVRKAEGLPVRFYANAGVDEIRALRSQADLYWHSTGFDASPETSPERCESFGRSVIEAMAAGCIPFVVAVGGPMDFVRDGDNGFSYSTVDELAAKTRAVAEDPARAAAIRNRAVLEPARYSRQQFAENWRRILCQPASRRSDALHP